MTRDGSGLCAVLACLAWGAAPVSVFPQSGAKGPVAPLGADPHAAMHGMVMVPRFEGAHLPVEEGWTRLSFQVDRDHGRRDRNNVQMDLEAEFYSLTAAIGGRLSPDWEASAEVTGASWDGNLRLQRGNTNLIPDGDISSSPSRVVLRAKTTLPELDTFQGTLLEDAVFGAVFLLKLPIGGHNDLVDTGSHDVATALQMSRPLGPFWIHLQGGVTSVGTGQAFPTDEPLGDVWSWDAGIGWRDPLRTEWTLQVEGASSPFRQVASLDRHVAHNRAGFRRDFGTFRVETGAGWGHDTDSGKWSLYAAVTIPIASPWPRIGDRGWEEILR
ncbi:MAG: hypothetical protein HY608_06350 [Planctomycetes bacterium]|nr:hypothetical protein [Planctomycetota bacterium]